MFLYYLFSDEACTRRTNSTFFFAYSNELDSRNFLDIAANVVGYTPFGFGYTTLAHVRFDVQIEEPIQYHSDILSFNQSIYDRFPDPKLGYTDSRGSNVLHVLQNFLDNTQAPLCGSLVYVLVGRYPDEADVSRMINQLRDNHVFVYFIAKAKPSAGNDSTALFDVSSATNGFCSFADAETDHIISGIDYYNLVYEETLILEWNYQYISQNYVVSGLGSIEMPVFATSDVFPSDVLFIITLQDHALENNVSLNYTFVSADGTQVFNGPSQEYGQFGNVILDVLYLKSNTDYKSTINFSYPNAKLQRIEVRMHSYFYHDFLPLPPI